MNQDLRIAAEYQDTKKIILIKNLRKKVKVAP